MSYATAPLRHPSAQLPADSPVQSASSVEPLRVGHLIKSLGRGGAESLLAPLAQASREIGIESSVAYFLPWKDAMVPELEEAGCPVECLQASSNSSILLSSSRVRAWVQANQLEVLHCHLPLTGVVGRLAGRTLNTRIAYTEHNLQERYRYLTRLLNRLTWGLQQHVVAVSTEVADSIERAYGPRVPVSVVLNGIDTRRFRAGGEDTQVRRRLGIPAEAPLVGNACVFRKQKRLDHWIQSAEEIARAQPETHFLLVGDGPGRLDIEARVAKSPIAAQTHLPGLQDDVAPFLGAMDVFMISSEFEGLPLVLLEAMAAGVPVASTAVGGIREALPEASQRHLCAFGDTSSLAQNTLALLREPELARATANVNAAHVEEHHGVAQMAEQLASLYRQLASAQREVSA